MKNTFVFVAAVAAGCVCAQGGTYTPAKPPFECFCSYAAFFRSGDLNRRHHEKGVC